MLFSGSALSLRSKSVYVISHEKYSTQYFFSTNYVFELKASRVCAAGTFVKT